MNALAIAGQGIRTDADGRYCLNDLHRASGSEARHRPGYWLELDQTKALAVEIEKAGIPAIWRKPKVGTFVARELVYAYAMWISPAFNLQVIRSFDALQTSGRSQHDVQAALNDPETLRALLLDHADARLRLQAEADQLQDELDRQAPRAAAYDRLASRHDAMSLTAAGKVLGIAQHQFIAWLSTLGWIYRAADHGSWLGNAERIKRGHVTHRMCEIERAAGFTQTKPQVLVTAAGIAALARLLEDASTSTSIPARHN